MDMKKEKLKEYLAPKMELFQFALEKGFAVSEKEELSGATEGEQSGTKEVGKYQDGINWSGHDWNENN